jgi:hypothetical protein
MNPDRAAMLLAFAEESEILSRRQIMDRAFVNNTHMFETLIESKFIAALPWAGALAPREYVLTESGRVHRDLQNVSEALRYG